MTRQHQGDHIRRTQSRWQRENGEGQQKPPAGHVSFEEAKRARENGGEAHRGKAEERGQPRIKLIPFEQISLSNASVEWSIKDITPRQGVGLMWGPSQTYKSFQEVDQGLHIALGWNYRGHRVNQGAVVYCAFEGGMGVSKRVEAWRQRYLADHADIVPFYLQPMRLALVRTWVS